MEQKVFRVEVLTPLLEETYRTEYTEYPRRNLRFSDAGAAADEGEKCEREIYYDIYNSQEKSLLTSGSLVMFDDGHIHEADIRRRLRLVLRSPERELSDEEIRVKERPTSGKIDNTIQFSSIKEGLFLNEALKEALGVLENGDDPVLEIKTTNEFTFQEIARTGLISQTYYDQVQMYLHASHKKFAIVLIKNRNSNGPEKGKMPYLEFVILPDVERQEQIRAGLKTVAECINNKILPPRPFLRNSTKCSYCRHKFTCWGEEMKEEAPVLETDDVVEAPSQEILEGAIRLCNDLGKQIKDLETQYDEAKVIVERYFKATKQTELSVGKLKATYITTNRGYLDKGFLSENLTSKQLVLISEPSKKLLEAAIADRQIDAKVLEDATKYAKSFSVRISEIKPPKESERVKVKTETSTTASSSTSLNKAAVSAVKKKTKNPAKKKAIKKGAKK